MVLAKRLDTGDNSMNRQAKRRAFLTPIYSHSQRRPFRRAAKTFRSLRMEHLEHRNVLAAVSWDGGGNGTSWSDPLNWSTNSLPGLNDDVLIDVPGNVTI